MTFASVKNLFRRSPRLEPRPSVEPRPANDGELAGRRGQLNDLKILARFDTIFIIDDSTSMETGGRWQTAQEALKELIELVKDRDANGIDIYFLNAATGGSGIKTQAEVDKIFSDIMPNGLTPIGERLKDLIIPYIESLPKDRLGYLSSPIKPRNYIVLTDGAATDEGSNHLDQVIPRIMKELDDRKAPLDQLGIQFVQVGDDVRATEFLNKLDNDLAGSRTRDIVDTFPYSKLNGDIDATHLVKILLGSIAKRIDNYDKL